MQEAVEIEPPELSVPEDDTRSSIGLMEQAIRFSVVGVVNTAVDLAVLNTLLLFQPAGRSGVLYSLFKTISFLAAVTNSYLLNRKFTFLTRTPISTGQMTGYLIVSVVGLLINVGIATTVATFVPHPPFLYAYWPSIAAVSGIPCGLVWNFFGYRRLVFREDSRS